MKHEHIFIVVISIMFCVLTAVFILFPRSTFSELERRELAVFPEFDRSRLADGSYTRDVSAWFSDTEPMRDRFMLLHLKLKDIMALKLGADSDYVAFHAAEPIVEEPSDEELERRNRDIGEYENTLTEDAHTKVANAGIVILGSGPEVRALMAYGGNEKGGGPFADAVNRYKKHFGKDVNVYCIVIPTAGEYYAPAKVRNRIKPQLPTIRNIYSLLSDSVKAVDVYSVLGNHASEPIYLRTDHHWSPLGAYYAAEKFAEVAKVPFRSLTNMTARLCPDLWVQCMVIPRIYLLRTHRRILYITLRVIQRTKLRLSISLLTNRLRSQVSQPRIKHRFSGRIPSRQAWPTAASWAAMP